jgi:hypothetical protein
MDHSIVIDKLSENRQTFEGLLIYVSGAECLWRPSPDKWCLLELVCHLNDEEQHDFRARVRFTLENIKEDLPSIDPVGWVTSKKYIEQNYEEVLKNFLNERIKSIEWLRSLESPNWKSEYIHPKFGGMSAEFFLANWLAHDYLHFRQIITLKYNYLKDSSGFDIGYAGDW